MRSNALRQTRSYTSGIGYTVLLLIITVALLLVSCSGIAGAESFRPPIVVPSMSGPVVAPPGPTGVVHSDGTSVLSETPVNMSEINLESLSYVTSTVTVVSGPPAFLSGWSYRKVHSIAGSYSGAVSNYPIMLVLHRSSGIDNGKDVYLGTNVTSTFSDIRFTTTSNSPLSYWIESVVGDTATVWVKVPSIPSTGTQLYLYYGKSSAASESNGANVFGFFDDFSGSSLNSTWSVVSLDTTPSVSGGSVTVRQNSNSWAGITSTSTFGLSKAVRMKAQYKSIDGSSYGGGGFSTVYSRGGFQGVEIMTQGGSSHKPLAFTSSGSYWGSSMGTFDSNWHTWEVQRLSNSLVTCLKDSVIQNVTQSVPQSSIPAAVTAFHSEQVVDWVLVRDIVSPEPVPANWGQPEENTLPLIASFTSEPTSGTVPLNVTFHDTSTGTGISTRSWDFGDGSTGSGSVVSHLYTAAATRTVTLTITNSTGGSSSASSQVTISSPPPFYDNYAYRKSFTVNSPGGSSTNYPIQVILHRASGSDNEQHVYLGSGVTTTFSDIRFTTTSNSPLSYWVESIVGDTATVWVKVPSIPSTGIQLYLYYGKSSAASESNGGNVFSFFDDFSGTSLNSTWSVVSLDTTPSVSGGSVTVRQNSNAWAGITSTQTFGLSKAVRMKAQYKSFDSLSYGGGGFSSVYGHGVNQGAEIMTYGGASHRPMTFVGSSSNYWGTPMGTMDQSWHTWEVQRSSGSLVKYSKDSALQDITQSIPQGSIPAAITAFHAEQVVDWVLVRELITPEPSPASWGQQEENTLPLTASFTAEPTSGTVPLNVTFRDTSTGTGITTRSWDFGDGGTGSGTEVSHLFSTVATRTVTLTITNSTGGSSSASSQVTINSPPPFYDTFSYRKSFTVSSPGGSATNYPIQVFLHRSSGSDNGQHVYVGSGVTASFSDIRFTTTSNSPLSYWVESIVGDTATVWVKVPSIPSTGTQLYLYYGKSSAASESNGANVFSFFDDFSGSSLNSTWSIVSLDTTPSVSGGSVTVRQNSNAWAGITSTQTFGLSKAVRMKAQYKSFDSLSYGGGGFSSVYGRGVNQGAEIMTYGGASHRPMTFVGSSSNYWGTPMGTMDQSWHTWEVQRSSGSLVKYSKDSALQDITQSIPQSSIPAAITAFHAEQVVDWVLVREFVTPEPSPASWGQQEENTLPLTASFTSEPTSGTVPLNVTFRDTSTGTGIGTRSWDFGDGGTGSGSVVSHLYTTAATWTVTLTITNSTGGSSSASSQVTINSPPPFYDNYAYRKSFTVSSPGGSATNYPVQVFLHRSSGSDNGQHVYVGSGVAASFSDIRFTTTSNSPLSYWVESIVGDTATVWVKVSSIPTTGTQVYLYYGKSSAASESNGANVFGFFDDFSGSSLNSTWSVVSLDTTPSVTGGSVTVRQNSNVWAGITSTQTFGLSKAVRMKAQYKSFDSLSYGGGGFSSVYGRGVNQGAEIMTFGGASHRPMTYIGSSSNYWGTPLGTLDQSWHTWEVQRSSGSLVKYSKDSTLQDITQSIPQSSIPAAITAFHAEQVVDWVLVRELVTPEPSPASWGQQEENTLPLTASFTSEPISGTVPLNVTFRDTSTGTGISTRSWDFGDGGTGSGSVVSHIYTTAATRTVTLTITNSTGGSSSASSQVTINPPPPFYDTFSYRKSFTVNSPGDSVTNYPIQVFLHRSSGSDNGQHVYVGSGVTASFSDIRFTTTSNSPLSYWVESIVGDTATIWVKVPSIPSTGTQLYLYYGKSSAASESNGANVFSFFDDFSGSSLNSTWSVVSLDTIPSVSGGSVTVRQNSNVWAGITSTQTFGLSKAVRMKAQYKSFDSLSYGGGGFSSVYGRGVNQGAEIMTYGGASHRPMTFVGSSSHYWGTPMGTMDQSWHTWEVQRSSGSLVKYSKDSVLQDITQSIPQGSIPAAITAFHAEQVVDWVLVRELVTPEPSLSSWGEEEMIN